MEIKIFVNRQKMDKIWYNTNNMKKQLIIMPFDHRGSFKKHLIGTKKITKKQHKELEDLKKMIYQAFLNVYKKHKKKDNLAILVDEEFGAKILKDAKKRKIQICLTTEKSGQKQYGFEYGSSFGKHINKFKPDYVKALVRYNPLNKNVNKAQLKKLKRLSDFCKKNNYKLLIELLVPATDKDLKLAKTEKKYEKTLRLTRTVQAIKEIKQKVKVDIWKMEGFSAKGWKRIIKVVPKTSSIIFLGRGEDDKKVKKWLMDAKKFEQIIGFAIGRTIFLNALKRYQAKKISKSKAQDLIAKKFQSYINLWNK